jgi:hypothetical protein
VLVPGQEERVNCCEEKFGLWLSETGFAGDFE